MVGEVVVVLCYHIIVLMRVLNVHIEDVTITTLILLIQPQNLSQITYFSSNFLVWNFAKMEEADIEDIKMELRVVIFLFFFFVCRGKMVKETLDEL